MRAEPSSVGAGEAPTVWRAHSPPIKKAVVSLLTVSHLYCGYGGRDVIFDISCSVKKGERLYISGPNGCGKTTLLKCIAGLLPFRGEVLLEGKAVGALRRRELAKKVGILSQLSAVSFPYTVFDTVALGRYAHQKGIFGELSKEDRSHVEDCLSRLGLCELREKKIGELSGGQLQRVFLARLFAQDPEMILLDEPTNHLDLKYQLELLEYVTAWSESAGKTVVGVLHDLNLVHAFAKRVLLLKEGRILIEGAPGEALSPENLECCYQTDIAGWMKKSLGNWVR